MENRPRKIEETVKEAHLNFTPRTAWVTEDDEFPCHCYVVGVGWVVAGPPEWN